MAPDFRKLRLLAIGNYPVFSFESLKELIRKNPRLETLRIGEKSRQCDAYKQYTTTFTYPFGEVIEHIGLYLRRLKYFSYVNSQCEGYNTPIRNIPNHIIEHFVNALQHLESLALTGDLFDDVDVLLHRLSLGCTRIKYMEIYCTDSRDNANRMLNALKRFGNLKSLELFETVELDPHLIVPLVEHLSHLNDLQFELDHEFIDLSVFLELLQKCPSLENITVFCHIRNTRFTDFESVEIFSKFIGKFIRDFIGTVQQRKVKIQIKNPPNTLCSISNNEVILKGNVIMHLDKAADS